MIKAKDFFTIGTIACGFLVLAFASHGKMAEASALIVIGFILDGLDGFYARMTKTGNKFGAEFDCIADLVIYSMAPSTLLFFAYVDYSVYIASAVGIIPLLFGCIRLARFNVKKIEYPGFWMGFPRPGSALAITGFVNSHIFLHYQAFIPGALFVLAMGIMNITVVPYIGHHKRRFSTLQKIALISVVAVFIASSALGFGWDAVFILALAYLFSPAYAISKEERQKIRVFIRKWKKEQ